MIQANELRVGNYIKSDDGIICSLECIESKNFTDWNSGNDYSLIAKEIGTKDNYLNCINDSWKPIPLTEEILLKFGFEKTYYGYKYYVERILNFVLKNNEISLGYFDDDDWCRIGNPIKYVHHLQNLCHTLTGEELKI